MSGCSDEKWKSIIDQCSKARKRRELSPGFSHSLLPGSSILITIINSFTDGIERQGVLERNIGGRFVPLTLTSIPIAVQKSEKPVRQCHSIQSLRRTFFMLFYRE